MPGIEMNGVRYPAVSTEMFGDQPGQVTIMIVREGCVQLCEHDLLVEYARECLVDSRMKLADYADQLFVPHPTTHRYVMVEDLCFDHDGNTSKVVAFNRTGRLYEWAI